MSEKRTGCPRQRVQGSRRSRWRDATGGVDESPPLRHNLFTSDVPWGIRSGTSADLMSEKRTGCPRQRVQGSRRSRWRDATDGVDESPPLSAIIIFELIRKLLVYCSKWQIGSYFR